MNVALWRYEARRAGRAALLAPLIVVALGLLGILAAARSGAGPRTLPAGLGYLLEMAIPLATAVAVTTLVGSDPAVETQLALPVPYRSTILRRVTLTVTAGAPVAVALDVALHIGGTAPRSSLNGMLSWLSPTIALAGLGLLVAAALRDPMTAAGAVTAVWLLEELLPGRIPGPLYLFATSTPFHGSWWANRSVLIAVGAITGGGATSLLGRSAARPVATGVR